MSDFRQDLFAPIVAEQDPARPLADRPDRRHSRIDGLQSLEIVRRHGKDQFIVFAAVKDEFPNILARCRSPGFQLSARRNLVPVYDQFDAAGLGNFIGFTGQAVADVVQAVAMMLYQ